MIPESLPTSPRTGFDQAVKAIEKQTGEQLSFIMDPPHQNNTKPHVLQLVTPYCPQPSWVLIRGNPLNPLCRQRAFQ